MSVDEVSVRTLASGAADILERSGWQPSCSVKESGPCCLLNATGRATDCRRDGVVVDTEFRLRREVSCRVAAVLGLTHDDSFSGIGKAIAIWNDTKARPGEAIAVLRRVAAGEGAP